MKQGCTGLIEAKITNCLLYLPAISISIDDGNRVDVTHQPHTFFIMEPNEIARGDTPA